MHGRFLKQWGCALTLTFVSIVTHGSGQEPGLSYPDINARPPISAADRSPSLAAGLPTVAANESVAYDAAAGNDYPTLAREDPAADLAKRVSDLEKQLADLSKAKAAPPTKPLIVPTGRIQFDASGFTQDANSIAQFGDVRDAVGFRRARIALLGEYKTIDYIIEMDFTGRGADALINSKAQQTAFKDVYIQMRELPVLGNVRAGHFKECFGLDQMNSDNYTTFMERSICDEGTFVPGRNNGIMAFDWAENKRATWALGAFTNQTGFDQPPLFQYDYWGLDVASRVTYLPWYDEPSGGRGYLHTGFSYVYRGAPDHTANFAARPENAFGPAVINMASTKALTDVNHWQVFDLESALVYGPLSFQSEFFGATVDRQADLNNNFYGMYGFVSYFLTGESRPYNRKMGVFDRVRPYEDFFRVRTSDGNVATGLGAWEVAYRFSYVDMLDGLTNPGAGRAVDHTIGLNWYLNPYTRVMFDYVHSQDTYNAYNSTTKITTRITDGNINMFMARIAMDF